MKPGTVAALVLAAAVPRAAAADFLVRVWQSEDGLPGNVVRSLGQSPDGFLWVATAEGIARFDGIAFDTVEPAGGYRGRRFGFFRLFALPNGGVWVSTFQGGLLRVDEMRLTRVLDDLPQPNPPLVTRLLGFGRETWCRHGDRLCRIDGAAVTPVEPPPAPVLAAFTADAGRQGPGGRLGAPPEATALTDRHGGRWSLGPEQLLLHAPAEGELQPLQLPDLDPRVIVNELLEDREGNIWLATPGQGLVRIRYHRVLRFATGGTPHERDVLTALQTRDGTWWIANRGGGVDRIANGAATHFELMPTGYPRPVTTIFEDRRGRLWLGPRDGSVFEWAGDRFTPRFTDTQTPSKVKAIAEDAAGHLWFGGSQGLCRWNGTTTETCAAVDGIGRLDVSTLATLPDGTVLAGTTDGHVVRGKDLHFTSLATPAALRGRWVTSIVPVSAQEIWVSSLGTGIFLWRSGTWTQFDARDGLPDERITAMLLHGEDQFWCGSLGGILRGSRSELLRRTTNRDIQPNWLRLDRSDGMPTRECVGGRQPAACQDRDGTLWFPTGRGLAGVRPDRITWHRAPPSIHLRPVHINGSPHPLTGAPVVAGPGRVRLEFAFTGLCLRAPETVTYRTRLVGLDDEFRFIGTRRQVNYQAVPPGRYRFEVSATNSDGISTIQPAAAELLIRPHPWQTPWFITLATLAALASALAIGWAVARTRMRRRIQSLKLGAALETERGRIARDLHDDLGASLTELSILSALGAENPDASQLRPALEHLSAKAKAVAGTLDEIVWAANPREDSLRSLVDYLCAFAREFADSAGIPLRTEVDRSPAADLPLGPRRRHHVFLATREALNNAVKHAAASTIRLRVAIDAHRLVVRVEDDGRGFDPATAAAGNGLPNIRRRMADSGGACTIDSRPGHGTTVTITLPLPHASAPPTATP